MGPSNGLSCETGSFSCHLNPHRILQPKILRLRFPVLEPWVARSVLFPGVPLRLPTCECGTARSVTLPRVLSARMPVSAPPTSLDECFFFNSLVVGLLYSLVFWQSWLFFVFKLVAVLLLVVRGSKEYLLCLHFGQENHPCLR